MIENKVRILIADDEPSLRNIITTILEAANYSVCAVCCGEEALNAFKDEPFDLVMLDVNMPDMDGFEVLKRLKPMFEGKYIPVVFLTVSTEIEHKLKALKSGAVDYLVKPVSPDELVARVENFLALKKQHDLLLQSAVYDKMTGVLNKEYFSKRVEEEVSRAVRDNTNLSLIFIDGDKFKTINDTVGHMAGDKVIEDMGLMLRNIIRDVDLIGRFGGDEFVVLLPNKGKKDLEAVCKRIKKYTKDNVIVFEDKKIKFTVSQGATFFSGTNAIKANDLIYTADECLYAVKDQGGNDYCINETKGN